MPGPTTRSQTANNDHEETSDEINEQAPRALIPIIFEQSPASPSLQACGSTPVVPPASVNPTIPPVVNNPPGTMNPPALALQPSTTIETATERAVGMLNVPAPRANSIASTRRSTNATAARVKQIEYAAEERLAALRRREIQMETALIMKKRDWEVAQAHEDAEQESLAREQVILGDSHVDAWLRTSIIQPQEEPPRYDAEQERAPAVNAANDFERQIVDRDQHAREKEADAREMEDRARRLQRANETARATEKEMPTVGGREGYHRSHSPTPPQDTDRGIERLAKILEKLTNNRPPPRQAQELPLFSGDGVEWLPLKAAMRDSTRLYKYSHAENIARLRGCLRGEAKEAVAALLYSVTDPEVIMATLEQRFGRPEAIVDRTMEDIRRLPRIGTTAGELNVFAVKVQNIVHVLSCIEDKGYLHNPLMVREVTEKMSPHLISKWCDFAEYNAHVDEPEVKKLSRFLMQEADRVIRHAHTSTLKVATSKKDTPAAKMPAARNKDARKTQGAAVFATTDGRDGKQACLCCGGNHEVPKCDKFTAMPNDQRRAWLKQSRICFKCVASKHRRFSCKAKLCGVNGCTRPHHPILHEGSAAPAATATEEKEKDVESVMAASVTTTNTKTAVLLKVCPVTIMRPSGLKIRTHALLDEGSTVTLIDHEIARNLHADGPSSTLHINSVNNVQREEVQTVKIKIQGKRSDEYYSIVAKTLNGLNLRGQTIANEYLRYPHLQGLPAEDVCYETAIPKILIGADNWHLIVSRKLLVGKKNEPVASQTQLGWVMHGTVPRIRIAAGNETVLHLRAAEQRPLEKDDASPADELNALIKSHFEIDALGISLATKPRPQDERAKDIFSRTRKKIDGHFEVGLPWQTDDVTMPPSYDMALRRLRSIERKMDRSPEFKEQYTAQVKNLLDKGYAAEYDCGQDQSPREWFLPHFAVTNPNKPGKCRLVFDAAAKSNEVCLNDKLLDGPDLLQALPGILFRFRERPIAVTADIREMFLRVKIRKEDQPAQLFLWRGDEREAPPTKYVMKSMLFGARSSPFLAHSVRDENANDHATSYPRAHYAITNAHYMDDYVDSYATEDEAIATADEVRHVHAQANFELAGWNSNSDRVLGTVPRESHALTHTRLGSNPLQHGKTLGLLWIAQDDELGFNTTLSRVPEEVRTLSRVPTKREALSAVMSIFDPLGLLSYYTVAAKILLQNLWRQKIGWDEPLPEKEAGEFHDWLSNMEHIAQLRLPRCYSQTGGESRKQLHVFNDASEQAFATAAYWRTERHDGTIEVVLAAAKAKVAPIKTQSIPRLELQANLIGTRLADAIQRDHRWKAEKVVYWSDSRTALHWIRNETKKYTPYVAHRIGEIAELTSSDQWRWIPTDLNVADDATRLNHAPKTSDDRWFTGPAFLRQNEEDWPKEPKPADEAEAEVLVTYVPKNDEPAYLPRLTRFSSYERLIRATARVLQFIDACRRKTRQLELRHIEQAEKLWIQHAQNDDFADDVACLQGGRHLKNSSRLTKLDPMLEDGVLRIRSRIEAANVAASVKRPIILDGRHKFTRLLVLQAHCNAGHASNERVVNDLRQKYWILHLRPTVRTIAIKCALCKVRRATPKMPVTGDLPAARLSPYARPFSYCGVDYFGPMTVTIGRRHEKRWGALFTCLTTRAVHIELVTSLSTDSAIMALRRMAARRGWPHMMYSDNATCFRGADTELRAAMLEWAPALRDCGLQHRMEWRYIPPGAPNQGGAWERLVRSVKTALTATLCSKSPKEEVLTTLLSEAEYSINARPLTHVSVEKDDEEAITPNHFLLGSSAGIPTTGPCDEADRRTWRATQALADCFWRRWLREYLPTLVPRGNSDRGEQPLREGDLVIVVDPTLPRNVWPRGVVEKTYPGPDGGVRCADVRTRGGVFKRPTSKLAVLPIQEESAPT